MIAFPLEPGEHVLTEHPLLPPATAGLRASARAAPAASTRFGSLALTGRGGWRSGDIYSLWGLFLNSWQGLIRGKM